MPRARPSVALLALLLALAGSHAPEAARTADPPRPFLPDGDAPGAPPLDGEAWSLDTPFARAKLERIDDATRVAFIRESTGFAIDPFATTPERSGAFLTFRFDLENRSGGLIVFQPAACRLIVSAREVQGPIDLPTLQSSFSIMDREMPPAFANVRKALFDGEVLLHPGERTAGLLVYRSVDPKARAFRVEVAWTTASGSREGFEATYRRPKKKRG